MPSKEEQYGTYIGRIARGAGISTIGLAINRTLRFATQLALARMYGPTQLGFYALGASVFALIASLAQFGMDQGLVRYVAEHRARGDVSSVRGTILFALGVTFLCSLAFAGSLFLGAGFLADKVFDKPFLEVVFKAFSVAIPPYIVMSMALVATQGFQTMKPSSYVQQILQPLSGFGLIVVFYLLGAQIMGAVTAFVISMFIGAAVSLPYLNLIFPKLLDHATSSRSEPLTILSVSIPMGVVNLTRYLNAWGAVTIMGIMATAADVGIYNTAARTGMLQGLILIAFSGIFNPIISDLYSRGLLHDLGSMYQDVCRWIFTGSLAMFLPMVFLAKEVMAVFGAQFVRGWPVLILIAGAQLFNSSVGPTNRILAMTGNQKMLMIVLLGSTAVSLGGSVILIPLYGAMGAGLATAVGIVLYNAIAVVVTYRLLGVWPYTHLYLKPLVAGSLSVAVVLILRLAVQLPNAVITILVLGSVFLLVFVPLMLALGLNASDRQFLKSNWEAVSRSVRGGGRT